MQREEKKKPRVRLVRNADGSVDVPRDKTQQSDDLIELWGRQSASLELPRLSIKEELTQLKRYVSSKKHAASTQHKAKMSQKTTRPIQPPDTGTQAEKQPITETRPITITLHIPALRIPKRLTPNTKKPIIVAVLVFVVVVSGVFIILRLAGSSDTTTNGEVQGAVTGNIETNVVPSFPVLTPNGNGVADLGGFANIAPKDALPVYAYNDAIGDKKIKVSQQKLPDTLRTDQAVKLKDLAESFNAKTPLEVGDNTAYIGATVKGAQSVIYVKGENLVLIASDDTISNADWVTYLGNLKY